MHEDSNIDRSARIRAMTQEEIALLKSICKRGPKLDRDELARWVIRQFDEKIVFPALLDEELEERNKRDVTS